MAATNAATSPLSMANEGPVAALELALTRWPAGPLLAALSGGPDSVALLHALSQSPAARSRGLRAIHVDHGLHPDSAAWAGSCAQLSAALGVVPTVLRVEVRAGDAGLEAAARDARYAAIAGAMRDGEIVVTAHHADDQAETLLLRLVRGAGPRGLAAMRALRPLGRGWLARPWLAQTRAAIEDYGRRAQLPCVDDPANRDPRFDRTHLREQVLPALAARWPHAPAAIARSAELLRDLSEWLDSTVAQALAHCRAPDPATLHAARVAELPRAARAEVLRAWFLDLGLPPPERHALDEIEQSALAARSDALPRVSWPGADLRRWRGLLYALAPQAPAPAGSAPWDGRAPHRLPEGAGSLELGAPVALPLTVSWRAGGERIRVDAASPRRELKTVLQELGVPPWLRKRAPLVWHGDELWAAGDWVAAHALREYEHRHQTRLRWLRSPG